VKLFAYGTLARRHRIEALVGRRLEDPLPAVLPGYRKHDTQHGYPIVLPDPAGQVEGLLWEIDPADLPSLDHYEGTDEDPPYYYRRRVQVRTGTGWHEAVVYVGNPDVFTEAAFLS
jgi:gamma-glutamylcyclotransferase (GGCT)/AIG2-like uncharacterized protein YtfP